MHARLLGALALIAALFVAAPTAYADVDPAGCTPDLQYDPSIPKYFVTDSGVGYRFQPPA